METKLNHDNFVGWVDLLRSWCHLPPKAFDTMVVKAFFEYLLAFDVENLPNTSKKLYLPRCAARAYRNPSPAGVTYLAICGSSIPSTRGGASAFHIPHRFFFPESLSRLFWSPCELFTSSQKFQRLFMHYVKKHLLHALGLALASTA